MRVSLFYISKESSFLIGLNFLLKKINKIGYHLLSLSEHFLLICSFTRLVNPSSKSGDAYGRRLKSGVFLGPLYRRRLKDRSVRPPLRTRFKNVSEKTTDEETPSHVKYSHSFDSQPYFCLRKCVIFKLALFRQLATVC